MYPSTLDTRAPRALTIWTRTPARSTAGIRRSHLATARRRARRP